uniref:hypothetical protein n=1 Tax=Roseovarius sp. TaxID=1486281 RepID=UPI00356379B1
MKPLRRQPRHFLETGSNARKEPLPSGARKGSGKLEPFVGFFVELIEQDPDITLVELQAALLTAHEVACST